MIAYKSTGVLRYETGKVFLAVDQAIANYYRALIPWWIKTNPPKYSAHISVVRNETPSLTNWGKHEGRQIDFWYYDQIVWDDTYYWLEIHCPELQDVRAELELSPQPWWENKFHLTIANCKNV